MFRFFTYPKYQIKVFPDGRYTVRRKANFGAEWWTVEQKKTYTDQKQAAVIARQWVEDDKVRQRERKEANTPKVFKVK